MSTLLTDEQMTRFLRDGFVVLQPRELDAAFHAAMWRAAGESHDEARGQRDGHLQIVGDNLRARIPGVARLLDAPTVRDAVTSVLGEDWLLHPHHFVHQAGTADQSFHQDGNLPWNERGHYRSHRPNWAMLFYYPQEVTDANGPTEVLPGTQYWTTNFEKPDGSWHPGDAVDKSLRADELNGPDHAARDQRLREVVNSLGVRGLQPRRIRVPAGGIVLAHYDLMHRGTRAGADWVAAGGRRFMYKFYFLRTREPEPAAWRSAAPLPAAGLDGSIDGVVRHIWHWLRGEQAWAATVVPADQVDRVRAACAEDERVRLAYEIGALARRDAVVRRELGRLLTSEDEALRRSMAYAVGVAGAPCVDIVANAMRNEDPRVRRVAAFAAGEARLADAGTVAALFRLLETDADDLARSNAAYALGHIARLGTVSASRLLGRLRPEVEPDNTTSAGLSRSTVRANIAYALCNMTLEDADLQTLAEQGLADHDRYVRGLAVAALERHARARGAPWLAALVAHLASARFNRRSPRARPAPC